LPEKLDRKLKLVQGIYLKVFTINLAAVSLAAVQVVHYFANDASMLSRCQQT